MAQSDCNLLTLVQNLLRAFEALRPYDIQSMSDFAEFLFERALHGKREKRGNRGFDVRTRDHGRVQVKYRLLPRNGRKEERLHCKNLDPNEFDSLGAVIFNPDGTIKKGLVIRREGLWQTYLSCPDPEKKIAYSKFSVLPAAIELTRELHDVLGSQPVGDQSGAGP